MSDEVLDIFISVLSRLSPSQHSRGNAHTPRTRTSRSRCHQWTRQCQRRRRTAHPTAPRDARKMHLSAHEDGRQLALLDPHTKQYRSAPTKEIRMRFFCGYQRTQAGQECTERPRSKRTRDARKTYTCAGSGAHIAAAISGCSLVPFAGAALGALLGASLAATDAATAASAARAVLLMRVALRL